MNKKTHKKSFKKSLSIKRHGSLLIGVMIIFLMLSAISLAIINRTMQGLQLTSDSKKGYITYQKADEGVEGFLSKLNNLDNGVDGGYAENQIPENTIASSFCSGVECFEGDGSTLVSGADKVTTIFNTQAEVLNQGITRSVYAPISDRVDGGLTETSSMTAKQCGVTGSLPACNGSKNKCDIVVRADKTLAAGVKNYEIRKSSGDNDDGSLENGAGDFAAHYGWLRVDQRESPLNSFFIKNQTRLIKNGDPEIPGGTGGATSGGQYGETYYFTIKARNEDPFKLDSLYLSDNGTPPLAVKKVDLDPNPSCGSNLNTLGCVTSTYVRGAKLYSSPYNCCNGSECWECTDGWVASGGICCIQSCGSDLDGYLSELGYKSSVEDEVKTLNDSTSKDGDGVTTGIGYCGKVVSCQAATGCANPYRKAAYCDTCPGNTEVSIVYNGIRSSSWSKANKIDIDMSPEGAACDFAGIYPSCTPLTAWHYTAGSEKKPRCCKHECPSKWFDGHVNTIVNNAVTFCGSPYGLDYWDTSGTTCVPKACEYEINSSCILHCKTGWNKESNSCCTETMCSPGYHSVSCKPCQAD